jgi:hypothetical protein
MFSPFFGHSIVTSSSTTLKIMCANGHRLDPACYLPHCCDWLNRASPSSPQLRLPSDQVHKHSIPHSATVLSPLCVLDHANQYIHRAIGSISSRPIVSLTTIITATKSTARYLLHRTLLTRYPLSDPPPHHLSYSARRSYQCTRNACRKHKHDDDKTHYFPSAHYGRRAFRVSRSTTRYSFVVAALPSIGFGIL